MYHSPLVIGAESYYKLIYVHEVATFWVKAHLLSYSFLQVSAKPSYSGQSMVSLLTLEF